MQAQAQTMVQILHDIGGIKDFDTLKEKYLMLVQNQHLEMTEMYQDKQNLKQKLAKKEKANDKLKEDYASLKTEREKQISTLKRENQNLKEEMAKLRANAQCLRKMAIYGNDPRRYKVPEAKPDIKNGDNFKGSLSMFELRKFSQEIYVQRSKKKKKTSLMA